MKLKLSKTACADMLVVKTFQFTELANGYWIGDSELKKATGGSGTFKEFKSFIKLWYSAGMPGDGRPIESLFLWVVCNGTAHMLSVKTTSLIS